MRRAPLMLLPLIIAGCVAPWDDEVLLLVFDGYVRAATTDEPGSACGISRPVYARSTVWRRLEYEDAFHTRAKDDQIGLAAEGAFVHPGSGCEVGWLRFLPEKATGSLEIGRFALNVDLERDGDVARADGQELAPGGRISWRVSEKIGNDTYQGEIGLRNDGIWGVRAADGPERGKG